MPTYLVERNLPGRDRTWLEAAVARLRKQRRRAAHLGSTYVPADDACFCRFEAETADDVRDANEIAGFPFARIVPAEEIDIGRRPNGVEVASVNVTVRALTGSVVLANAADLPGR